MDHVKVYRTSQGVFVERDDETFRTDLDWNALFMSSDAPSLIDEALRSATKAQMPELLAPLDRQEVWAAGVTYTQSRTARMSESERAGAGSFYDRVYDAERPELFFKATKSRLSGPGETIRVRRDSSWSVPEPELALAVSSDGRIFGYTVGNDVSARDIEGENPLYLPQAKIYHGACALGPSLLLSNDPPPGTTEISLAIVRNGSVAFDEAVHFSRMRRTSEELVDFLFRENVFPDGCYLLTGTGIVPPDDFSLQPGDEVSITIESVGTLVNTVA